LGAEERDVLGDDSRSAEDAPSFRQMAEALGLGMAFQIHAPPDGQGRRFTYLSSNCEQLTRVPRQAALADATRLYSLILPEHMPAMEAAEARSLANLSTFEVEVEMDSPSGDTRWVRIVSTPRRLADGSTLWDGILMDITDARRASEELKEQRRRLEAAVEATGLGLWEWDLRSGALTWTDRNRELFGLPPGAAVDITRYQELVHPDDRATIAEVYRVTSEKTDGGDFVFEHRTVCQPDEKPRWLQARGRVIKDEGGVKLVVGATLDITERKASEERRSLLMGELAHRAKNGIAVMMAIVAQTARGVGSVKEFEDVLMARLKAMADSQDLVTASGGRPVALSDVVATTLTPFDASRFEVDRSLEEITIAGEVAVSLGLLLHELSTNAVKYGALSRPAGRVSIQRGDGASGQAVLKWAESGGPEVRPATRKGFGSRLLDVSLRPQGGKVEPLFAPDGFQADIHFPEAPGPRQGSTH
jgi:PAS domain S-box-containing protein